MTAGLIRFRAVLDIRNLGGDPEEEIRECISGELTRSGIEGKLAEPVGAAEGGPELVMQKPPVAAHFDRVPSLDPRKVVGKLNGSRSAVADIRVADRTETSSGAEIKSGEP